MSVIYIRQGDRWPEGVSDGLALPCAICGNHTNIDYGIDDDVWRKVVPESCRRDVVCLGCLIIRAGRGLVAESLRFVQITFPHMTIVCEEPRVFVYNYLKGIEPVDGQD